MKLRENLIALTAITWLTFMVLSFVGSIYFSVPMITLATIIAAIFVTWFFIILICKRIAELNHKVTQINIKNRPIYPIELKGNDELGSIRDKINTLINEINILETQKQELHKTRGTALEKANKDLLMKGFNKRPTDRTEMLTRLAHYDDLTSLPNRIFFNEILNKTINRAKRYQKNCAILVVHLDAFEDVNQKYGNNVGDEILKEISNRLTKALRAEDILARLDSNEFVVLINDISKPKFASSVAEKILRACAKPINVGGDELTITASIGICIYPNDGASLESLFKNIEVALDIIKQAGGNGYQFYTQEMNIEAHEFIELESALRKAIQRNELALYYQPKLDIKKGKINGVEALIRWIHPTLGIINPSQFIQLADETGLTLQIAEWALREACVTNKYWQEEGYEHITIAVNLSPKQFHHPELARIIKEVINASGLNPHYLELEINEATIMDDLPAAIKAFDTLKSIGVRISIDHFGTGYTSISHLKLFPINALKMDYFFVKGLPYNPNDCAITNAFIALAHNLGLEIIAEGVETAEQVQYLSEHNCDLVQGYFLGHPLPAQKIITHFIKLGEKVLI